MSCQICHSWSCTCDPAALGLSLTPKDWVRWDRSVPVPEGLIFAVVLLDLSWDFSTPGRFYHDGVIAYWPEPIGLYTAK